MKSRWGLFIGIFVILIILGTVVWTLLNKPSQTGIFCGGIMGNICPFGYTCHYDGSYPDASGTCVRLFPNF
jgi:hypothetical protein